MSGGSRAGDNYHFDSTTKQMESEESGRWRRMAWEFPSRMTKSESLPVGHLSKLRPKVQVQWVRWTRSDLNFRCEVTSGPSSPRHPHPQNHNPQPTRTHHSAPTAGAFKRASQRSPLTTPLTTSLVVAPNTQDTNSATQPIHLEPQNTCNIQHWASRSSPILCGAEKNHISPAS